MSELTMANNESLDCYRLALFGTHINQSYSPQLHHYFAKQTAQRVKYTLKTVTPLTFMAALSQFLKAPKRGANITSPFKQLVLKLPQLNLTSAAREARSVNTIFRSSDHQLWGDNTDGSAWLQTILADPAGIPLLKTGRILILGAGGAAWSILAQLKPYRMSTATPILLGLRNPAYAHPLLSWFGRNWITPIHLEAIFTRPPLPLDLIVNATGDALSPLLHAGSLPIHAHTICYDLGYGSMAEQFLAYCQKQGAQRVMSGLRMLVLQGAMAFERWTGVLPNAQLAYKQLCRETGLDRKSTIPKLPLREA